MYKCLECGHTFDRPGTYEESHGFNYGPSEVWSVCPFCKENHYVPMMKDEIGLVESVDVMLEVMMMLNQFDAAITQAFNAETLVGSRIEEARSKLCDFMIYACCNSELDLPNDMEEKLWNMRTEKDLDKVCFELYQNIEEG